MAERQAFRDLLAKALVQGSTLQAPDAQTLVQDGLFILYGFLDDVDGINQQLQALNINLANLVTALTTVANRLNTVNTNLVAVQGAITQHP